MPTATTSSVRRRSGAMSGASPSWPGQASRDARGSPRTSRRSRPTCPRSSSIPRTDVLRDGDPRSRRSRVELRYLGRATRTTTGHRGAGDRRPVRGRPAGERRGPLRSATAIRSIGRRRPIASPSWSRRWSCRAMATTPARLRGRPGDGDRGAGDARPARPFRRDDARRRDRSRRRSPSYPAEDIRRPLERALEQLRGELD